MDLFDLLDHRKEWEQAIKPPVEPPTEQTLGPESISSLTARLKGLIEERFSDAWVVGEVSNLSRPRSGHVYFTLKDDGAQLAAVVWKSNMSKFKFALSDGMELVCRGRIDLFPPHGKYQLNIARMEPRGVGALELAYRQLHEKLAREGLFDPARKKPLPKSVRRVAVITSPSGAAIRDFLNVLGRRTRRVDLLIVPVRVQGAGAAVEIAAAVRTVNQRFADAVDVLVVTRGGGSAEDLWAFNEEPLVRAVAHSAIPVVSAVGHEIDVSLCDLAADFRALTPSEAAERIAQEDAQLGQMLVQLGRRMEDRFARRLELAAGRLAVFARHPVFVRPERLVDARRQMLDLLESRLNGTLDRRIELAGRNLAMKGAELEALSPLAILGRGYSLTTGPDGRRIRDVHEVADGDILHTRLANGEIESRVLTRTPR